MAVKKKRKSKPIARTTGKGGNYRPTKKGAGMTAKGVSYRKKTKNQRKGGTKKILLC
jgi:hypothetical protein